MVIIVIFMSLSYLQIKCITWNRESHGLFDYDTSQLTKTTLKVQNSGYLIGKGNEISFFPEYPLSASGLLLKIYSSENEFIIWPSKQERIGLVVKKMKSKKNRGCLLSLGDVFKIGRIKMKIIKLSMPEIEKDDSGDEFEGSNSGDVTCRICFRTHTNLIDPLLSICKCSGSMSLTHFKCLQRWFMSKALVKSNLNSATYSWKNIDCEICKESFPLTFKHDMKAYNILNVPLPDSDYIILEDSRKEKYKYIVHVLKAANTPLLIGRSTDTDLKINDISVSRTHATINFYKNQFYLKDCKSKFGTILTIKKPLIISKDSESTIQINRNVITLSLKSEFKFFKCLKFCCKKETKIEPIRKTRTEMVLEEESFHSPDSNFLIR
jgi:FHA domain/RING-variant domain